MDKLITVFFFFLKNVIGKYLVFPSIVTMYQSMLPRKLGILYWTILASGFDGTGLSRLGVGAVLDCSGVHQPQSSMLPPTYLSLY